MRNSFFSSLSVKSFAAVAVTALGTIALTGCGMGAADTTDPTAAIPAMQVKVLGGETPIANSVVTLWETDPNSTGYGLTARQIETATDSGSNFTFATGYSCTHSTDFLYVTATGGDVTNGSPSPLYNPNLVMMAALGSCANMATAPAQGAVTVIINEISTVAAAYALGNFMTVNANGGVGTQKVYIGAPATNNTTTGSCTGTGSAMSCTAAGLAHAFANALNLVNDTNAGGLSGPTAQAYTTVPGNSSASVPQAVINTLGNIMQFCTNTGNATSTDSTISANCTTFFTDATPKNGTAPTDTLTAMINVAHLPQYNVGSTCTGTSGGLFCLSSTFASFTPFLSAVPHDWSLGIVYSGDTQGTFGAPQYVALDANDNVYLQTAPQNTTTNTATSTGQAAMTSSGNAIWYNAISANQCAQGVVAPDTNGNVFFSVYAGSTGACSWGIYEYTASAGALVTEFAPGSGTVCNTASPTSSNCPGFPASGYDTVHPVQSTTTGIALDRLNNLWYNRRSTTCANCLLELPYTSGTGYGAATTIEGTGTADWDAAYQLVIDPTGNVYSSALDSAANIFVTPQTSPATPNTPSYTALTGYLSVAAGGATFGLATLDSAGNLWTAYASNYVELTPTLTSGVITGYSAAAGSPFATAGSKPQVGEFDGHDNLYAPSYSTSGLVYMQTSPSYSGYNATNVNAFTVQPCYAPSGASACSTTLSTSDPHDIQIDSTGAMWIVGQGSSTGAAGFLVQLIGTAYPTWPQLSYGKFGVTP